MPVEDAEHVVLDHLPGDLFGEQSLVPRVQGEAGLLVQVSMTAVEAVTVRQEH